MLIKSGMGGAAVLNLGVHRIPYQFQITNARRLPCTYIGSFGFITYSLEVKMDRIGVAFDDKTDTNLVIQNPKVLDFSQPLTPASFDGERTDCCLCCASGPVVAEATINRTTLKMNSDDVIDVTLQIDNLKGKSIVPKVYIEEVAYFRADGDRMCSVNKLCSTEGRPVGANTRRNVVELQVGPIKDLISGSIESPNISVFYRVTVRMKGSGFRIDHPINVGVDKNWTITTNTPSQPLDTSTSPVDTPTYPPVEITIYPPPHRYR